MLWMVKMIYVNNINKRPFALANFAAIFSGIFSF